MNTDTVATLKRKGSSLLDILLGEKAFCFYIIACMILVPLSEFISELFGYQLTAERMVFSAFGVIGAFMCTAKFALRPSGRHWSDIFFFTLNIFMFLSLIYSCDIARVNRPDAKTNEYPIFFVGYYCMMFAGFQLSSAKLRKYVLYTMVVISGLMGILGIMQTFGFKIMPVPWKTTTTQVYVLTQNTNFWGGLSVLFVGLTAGAVIFSRKISHMIISGISAFIAVYCSFNSMARLAWAGDIVVVVVLFVSLLIMMRKNKGDADYKLYLRNFFIFVAIAAAAVGVTFIISDLPARRIGLSAREMQDLGQGNSDSFGSDRGWKWKICLESFPKHWVLGVGIDNIYQCYKESIYWTTNMQYSNFAHNVYIQTLVTQGLFGFLNFMALLVISTVLGIKRVLKSQDRDDRVVTWICFAMFIGYSAAAFFNCRLFYVELYYMAIIGMMNARPAKELAKSKS
ncbi:O-antigen ligase [Ruminococcaceae bacterium YRB3002]|nr:O-antigen ligase [Ruminococcaceae bacterium YRB3002]